MELEGVPPTIEGKLIDSLRVVDLKQELKKRGLSIGGSKSVLVERLKAQMYLEKLQQESEDGSPTKQVVDDSVACNSFIQQYLQQQQETLRQRQTEKEEDSEKEDDKNQEDPTVPISLADQVEELHQSLSRKQSQEDITTGKPPTGEIPTVDTMTAAVDSKPDEDSPQDSSQRDKSGDNATATTDQEVRKNAGISEDADGGLTEGVEVQPDDGPSGEQPVNSAPTSPSQTPSPVKKDDLIKAALKREGIAETNQEVLPPKRGRRWSSRPSEKEESVERSSVEGRSHRSSIRRSSRSRMQDSEETTPKSQITEQEPMVAAEEPKEDTPKEDTPKQGAPKQGHVTMEDAQDRFIEEKRAEQDANEDANEESKDANKEEAGDKSESVDRGVEEDIPDSREGESCRPKALREKSDRAKDTKEEAKDELASTEDSAEPMKIDDQPAKRADAEPHDESYYTAEDTSIDEGNIGPAVDRPSVRVDSEKMATDDADQSVSVETELKQELRKSDNVDTPSELDQTAAVKGDLEPEIVSAKSTPLAVKPRRITLNTSKDRETETTGKTSPSVTTPPTTRKRRWGSTKNVTQAKKLSVNISTDMLKEIMPEMKQTSIAMETDEKPMSPDVSDDDDEIPREEPAITRTITQLVNAPVKESTDGSVSSSSASSSASSASSSGEEEVDDEEKETAVKMRTVDGSSDADSHPETKDESDNKEEEDIKAENAKTAPRDNGDDYGNEDADAVEPDADDAADPAAAGKKQKQQAAAEEKLTRQEEKAARHKARKDRAKEKEEAKLKDSLLAKKTKLREVVRTSIDEPVRARSKSGQTSPSRKPESNVVHIMNLVRPYTLNQLKELLARSGKLLTQDGFWIDNIKSHCFAAFSSAEEAVACREDLHGSRWPGSNPKELRVEFAAQEEMDRHTGKFVAKPPTPKPPTPKPPPTPKLASPNEPRQRKPSERDQDRHGGRGEQHQSRPPPPPPPPPMREWDRDRERSLSRERKRRLEREKRVAERRAKEEAEEPPAKLLDDLFRKTKATPCIYWLPLTEEQVENKMKEYNDRVQAREERLKAIQEEQLKKAEQEQSKKAEQQQMMQSEQQLPPSQGNAGGRRRNRSHSRGRDRRR